MAISGGDGSIVLTTQVDQAGLKKGINSIKSAVTSTSSAFKKLGGYIGVAFSVTALVNFSKEASRVATQTEASVQRLIDIYGEASQTIGDFIDTNARALGMSKSAAASYASAYGNLFSVWADQKTNAELTAHYLNMTAVVASKSGRTVEDVQERVRSGLLGNTEAIEDLGIFVNVKTIEMTNAFQRMADGRSWEQLGAYEQQQVRTLAILEQATHKYGNEVANTTALAKAQYRAAYEDLQETWGQFVNTVLMPVLNVLTQIMTFITMGMQALAGLTGKTIETSKTQASNAQNTANSIGEAVENQDDLTKSVKETAKAQKGMLAGFDKINKLTEETDSASDTPTSTPSGTVGGFTLPSIGDGLGQQETAISSTLASIMGIAGGALVAIGLILIATGNIAWGVGFIIAGALTLGVSMAMIKDTEISETVKNSVTKGIVIAGMFALVVGLLLCAVPGQLGYGLALVALGVVSLVGAVALNWKGIKEMLKGTLGDAVTIAGVAAIAFGVMMCVIQHWAVGIALIALGVISLVTVVTVNWEAIKEKLQGTLGAALILAGIVAIVIGILLCVATMWGPGIGLIVAGGVALAAPIAANWNVFLEKLKGIWGGIKTYWNEKIAPWFTKKKWQDLFAKIISGFSSSKFVTKIKEIYGAFKLYYDEKIKPWFTKTKWQELFAKVISGFSSSKFVTRIKEIYKAFKTYYDEKINPWFTKEKWQKLFAKVISGFSSSKFVQKIKDIALAFKTYYDEKINPWFTKEKWQKLFAKVISGFSSSKFVQKIKDIALAFKTYYDEKIKPWFAKDKWQKLFAKVISGFSSSKFVQKIKDIYDAFKLYYDEKIKPWFTKEKWQNLFGKVISGFSSSKFVTRIKEIYSAFKTYYDEKIKPWFTKTKWQELFAKVISGFSSSKFVTKIKEIYKAFKTYYDEKIKPWFTKEKWQNLFGKILSAFSSTEFVNKIKGIYNAVKLYYDEKIKPWFTKTKWQEIAVSCGEGLKSGFKNAINSIIGFFETLINRVIDKFNEISFTVPDWVPNVGGKKYGVNISKVSIPRLAKGAVIPPNREFLSILGDQKQGLNIETPLKTMIEAFNVALDRRDNIGNGEQTIIVTLDGDVLFKNTIKKNKNYILATGVNPLGI